MLRRRDALWSYDVSDGVDIADDTSIDGMGGKLEWWVTGDLAPGTLAGYEQADEGVGRGPGGPPHLRKGRQRGSGAYQVGADLDGLGEFGFGVLPISEAKVSKAGEIVGVGRAGGERGWHSV